MQQGIHVDNTRPLISTHPVCKRTRISRSVMARVKDLIGTARTWEIKVTVEKPTVNSVVW